MFVNAGEDVNGNQMKRILPIIEGDQQWNRKFIEYLGSTINVYSLLLHELWISP